MKDAPLPFVVSILTKAAFCLPADTAYLDSGNLWRNTHSGGTAVTDAGTIARTETARPLGMDQHLPMGAAVADEQSAVQDSQHSGIQGHGSSPRIVVSMPAYAEKL